MAPSAACQRFRSPASSGKVEEEAVFRLEPVETLALLDAVEARDVAVAERPTSAVVEAAIARALELIIPRRRLAIPDTENHVSRVV
jgi:hypothetical protein